MVLLPDLSRKLRAGNTQGAQASQNRAMELSLFLTLPATVALMVIPVPLINALFEHGAFTHSDTLAVAPTVAAFAAGLPAFSMTKVWQPGYFAREDTATPMRFATISLTVNTLGSIALFFVFGGPNRFAGSSGTPSQTNVNVPAQQQPAPQNNRTTVRRTSTFRGRST